MPKIPRFNPAHLRTHQRRWLVGLAVINLFLLALVVWLLVRPPAASTIPPAIVDSEACRRAIAADLAEASLSGRVGTTPRGIIRLEIVLPPGLSEEAMEATMEATMWIALEASSGHPACLGAPQVQVAITAHQAGGSTVTLRGQVKQADLEAWRAGEIGDDALAQRLTLIRQTIGGDDLSNPASRSR